MSSANLGVPSDGKSMRHVHVKRHWFRSVAVAPPWVVLSIAFVLYVGLATVVALLLLSCSPACFVGIAGDFGFAPMLWLSVHTLSTVGFGSISPSDVCPGAQILVLIESYVSLMVTAAIGGFVFNAIIRSRPPVRFSQKVLITKRGEGNTRLTPEALEGGKLVEEYLTFRVITLDVGALSDVHVKLQATLWLGGGDGGLDDPRKGKIVTLQLDQEYFVHLEQIQLYHLLDQNSPLYEMRQTIYHQLDGLDVIINAFDTRANQHVKVFRHYGVGDLIAHASFCTMFDFSESGRLECDHAKFDHYLVESPKSPADSFLKRQPAPSSRGGSAKPGRVARSSTSATRS